MSLTKELKSSLNVEFTDPTGDPKTFGNDTLNMRSLKENNALAGKHSAFQAVAESH